jgi:hypothetical protein
MIDQGFSDAGARTFWPPSRPLPGRTSHHFPGARHTVQLHLLRGKRTSTEQLAAACQRATHKDDRIDNDSSARLHQRRHRSVPLDRVCTYVLCVCPPPTRVGEWVNEWERQMNGYIWPCKQNKNKKNNNKIRGNEHARPHLIRVGESRGSELRGT